MSMFSKGLAAATMMAVTMLATSYGSANEPAVGDDAPDFTLPGSDGNSYHLADYKDKQVVVVAWFPKAFTGG